ncbi:hypothetical protein [Clostridium botulinum]|uniref:hypothetical protein n=1 Tax=Clostridium botulinum TaxID=1491 RepID=UPI00174A7A48|nr:hypothetical protein [Clostridium botulinum]MBD5589197.1 hypothetical protein [Clostridium botulinum]
MSQDSNIPIYEIYPTDEFNNNMKYYIKKKKYKSISKDINNILRDLEKGIFAGDPIADLKLDTSNKVYKIRAANTDTKQGKSSGYRLIYYVETEDKIVFLVTIYYKKDNDRIPTDKEIINLIKEYCI